MDSRTRAKSSSTAASSTCSSREPYDSDVGEMKRTSRSPARAISPAQCATFELLRWRKRALERNGVWQNLQA